MTGINTNKFDYVEYIVFVASLTLSALIGCYFGFIKGGQNTVSGYLLGGKKMTAFPVGMSLISSYISGITLLGVPTEIYTYGTQFLTSIIPYGIVALLITYLVLPVFFKLQLISLYEYMELRFSHAVRLMASLLYILQLLAYVPIVIYGPALALNQVSGMNIHIITPIVCTVCIFYTSLGGLKAVVWSDTLQGTVMIGSVLAVLFLGLQQVGGIHEVIQSSWEGDRLEMFNMDINPTTRLSFWSATFAFIFFWLANFAFSPASVQRYISLPTFRQACLATICLCIGVTGFTAACGFIGLIIYTKYKGCDPLTSKAISRADQILPLFVLDVAGHIRGFSGLFMAGVVCAALSSMSTALNTVAGTIYEDFVEPMLSEKPTEKKASLIMKGIVILFGIICTFLVFICEHLGPLIELATGFVGMSVGTTLGVFLLGMFFPCANTKGTIVGGVISIIFMMWLVIGNAIYTAKGLIKHPTKPISTEMCSNMTLILSPSITKYQPSEVFPLYRISVFYYSPLGCLIVLSIGIIVSLLTETKGQRKVNPDLLSPIVKYYSSRSKKEYNSVPLKPPTID
ncbi:hypothetical protein O3M35_011381 [Rhynocoris fuscipes]|uniref:Sodium-coupled monocarboxylate transporter 1 n=1 Tax=Rhynocoris fuscipes TaxID=488301 RepID=A0AAW1CXC9_9HEMI